MFNIGGGELLIIFLVALVVLGPTKLPEAARQIGKVMGEFRRLSSGFQNELRAAMDDPVERAVKAAEAAEPKPTQPTQPFQNTTASNQAPRRPDPTSDDAPSEESSSEDTARDVTAVAPIPPIADPEPADPAPQLPEVEGPVDGDAPMFGDR